jgi:hypothetical protein
MRQIRCVVLTLPAKDMENGALDIEARLRQDGLQQQAHL